MRLGGVGVGKEVFMVADSLGNVRWLHCTD
jgi:hypothetical protein